MNDFLSYEGRNQERAPPRRLYARLDAVEQIDESVFNISLDGVDADSFDESRLPAWNPNDAEIRYIYDRYFEELPLASFEFEMIPEDCEKFFDIPWFPEFPEADSPWLEVDVVGQHEGVQVSLYTNLFGEPRNAHVRTPFRRAPPKTAAALARTFSLDSVPKSSAQDIGNALPSHRGTDIGVLALDVGQGNCNALVDAQGRPLCYFDFGAAVQRHKKTYPAGLTKFCFHNSPPVILSHWDKDHWAAGNIDTNAQMATWIVPNQNLGSSHRVFAQAIMKRGRLLVWPKGLPHVSTKGILVEKCTGSRRNHSGLAVHFSGTDNSGNVQRALLPGDARYTAIPGRAGNFTHIVSPHHGATMNSSWVPPYYGYPHSRLVHSFGHPNKWKHPTSVTRKLHHGNGWRDTKVQSSATPNLTRETANRTHGYGHIFLPWDASTAIPSLPCCGTTSMTATQK